MKIPRRKFISSTSLLTASTVIHDLGGLHADNTAGLLRFGLIADIHKDVMHDADDRLRAFIAHAQQEELDFIIQMGDFCVPKPENQGFLDIWNGFERPSYHVLGNHDTDGGYKRAQTVAFLGMPSRFYSFDRGGFHFVVLDGNDRAPEHVSGYPRYIATDQLDWLKRDLSAATLPTLVFVHQSIERAHDGGVQNGDDVRQLLELVNADAGFKKVVACFSGHHHRDYMRQINGIAYPQINSASYFWVGGDYQKVRYGEAVDKAYPWIKYTVPYKDPLFATVTLDAERNKMTLEGRRSTMVGPAPWDMGKSREAWDAATLRAEISDRQCSIKSGA